MHTDISAVFPHAFVIGAQKSGTTSLCAMLEELPGIAFSKPKEPMILSRDEIALHPHFFARHGTQWDGWSWENNTQDIAAEYARCFAHAAPTDLRIEGSTSYLPSQRTPARIAEVNPQAKLIAVLRDPTARAYSAYWHALRFGATTHNFLHHLQYEGAMTIFAGEYARQIAHWLDHFPRAQCLFLIYEEMVEQPLAGLREVCAFLGLAAPQTALLPQANNAQAPRSLLLQQGLNHLRRLSSSTFSSASYELEENHPPVGRLLDRLEQWNWHHGRYAPMPLNIRERLNRYYREANRSLPDLIGKDPTPYWYR